jgi:hypothetical protein
VRILLDEQLPRQLAPHFVGHDVRTTQEQGWAGLKNGALLTQALSAGVDVLVTGDKNLEFHEDVAPDGRFLMVENSDDFPIVIVQNWAAELARALR